MKPIRIFLKLTVFAASVTLFSSCAYHAERVSASNFRTTTRLDPRDVAEVSAQMTESLLQAGVLRKKGSGGRSVVAISTFRNNTALYDFDPKMVFNRVTVTLNRTGIAYSYVVNDGYVRANRAAVSDENEVREFLGERQLSSGPSPQYSLTLELIEDHASVGRTTQKAYQIHMTLNDISSGLSIWEDIRDVYKMGTRPAIGF